MKCDLCKEKPYMPMWDDAELHLVVTKSSTGEYHVHGPFDDNIEMHRMIYAIQQEMLRPDFIPLEFSIDEVQESETSRRLLLIND